MTGRAPHLVRPFREGREIRRKRCSEAHTLARYRVVEAERRPVMADADSRSVSNVVSVEIESDPSVEHRILFDPGHGLEERLIREQFA